MVNVHFRYCVNSTWCILKTRTHTHKGTHIHTRTPLVPSGTLTGSCRHATCQKRGPSATAHTHTKTRKFGINEALLAGSFKDLILGPPAMARTHTHTHTHTHTRRQTHTHTQTDTHTRTHTQTHTDRHTNTHTYTHTNKDNFQLLNRQHAAVCWFKKTRAICDG